MHILAGHTGSVLCLGGIGKSLRSKKDRLGCNSQRVVCTLSSEYHGSCASAAICKVCAMKVLDV